MPVREPCLSKLCRKAASVTVFLVQLKSLSLAKRGDSVKELLKGRHRFLKKKRCDLAEWLGHQKEVRRKASLHSVPPVLTEFGQVKAFFETRPQIISYPTYCFVSQVPKERLSEQHTNGRVTKSFLEAAVCNGLGEVARYQKKSHLRARNLPPLEETVINCVLQSAARPPH